MDGETSTGIPAMRYQSENFSLDTDDYSLTRNGINHPIEPQVFDLLIYLIENRNRVVTREELLEHLWHGRIVSDSAINARLKEARKAVGDTGKRQRVIKTIHRRGYQFIADVIDSARSPAESTHQDPGPVRSSEKPSLAVVRFNNLSNDPAQQYFSDGMTVNVCSRLCRIRSLMVKSAVEYDPGNKSLSEISRELEVDYVLSGSVQREGEQVRVFVELTDGGSGQIKWSEHFDRRGNDVIGIQDEIAAAITGTLWNVRGTIREAERDKLLTKPISDFNAFDYVLKGIHYKEEYTAESIGLARECFEKAISIDPNSTEGYAWLAWMHLFMIELGSRTDKADSLKQAKAAANKSISIGSNSLLGHWALGYAYAMSRDVRRGLVEIDKALEINPDDPDLMITKGALLSYLGRMDEGVEWIQRGIDFNKQTPDWYFWDLGKAYFAGHQWQDAIDAFLRMRNQNKETLVFLVACYVQAGNISEAEKCMAELLDIDPEIGPEEVEETYSYLAENTLGYVIDSIKLLLEQEHRQVRLRVVKS